MARRHLLSLRAELAKNERLRSDFPGLCAPAKHGRRSVMDTQDGYLAESGAAIIVAGMDQGTLGIKLENRRPDLLIIDDGEPPDANYSDYQTAQRISTLREAILPMSLNAPVELVGTTTRLGSALDDVLKSKPWTLEERFVPHHFPALIVDEVTGEERSAWPHRWSIEYLRSIRHTHSFMKNYQCQPVSADGTHWAPGDFVYDNGTLARMLEAKVLAVDPAVTSTKRADQTGLAIVGYGAQKALVERATGVRMDPKALREMVHATLRGDPSIRTVLCEVTNGGEWITSALSPLPGGVRMEVLRPTQSKLARVTALFDHYQRGRVLHAKPLPALEAQQCAFPQVANDDIVDSVAAAVEWLFRKYRGA
jgi:phage terminase large subunit-like protein